MYFKKTLLLSIFFLSLPCWAQDDNSYSTSVSAIDTQALSSTPNILDNDDYADYGFSNTARLKISNKAHEVFPDNIMKQIVDAIIGNDISTLKQVLSPQYASTYTNTPGFNHTTFLMIASGTPNLEAIYYLIAMGADPNQKNDKGYNSLSAAMVNPYDEVLRTLLQYKGDANFVEHGKPLLWKAYEIKNLNKFQILLNANAKTNFLVNAHSFLEELMQEQAYPYFYYALLHTKQSDIKFNIDEMKNNILNLARNETSDENKFYLSQIYFTLMQLSKS